MDKEINRRITYYRKRCKLTQGEVAKKLGMKTSAYSQAEREGNIHCDMAKKLAEIFKIDIKSIIYENPIDDETRLLENLERELDFSQEISLNSLMLAKNGNETQLLTMFKKCNKAKQKTILQCVYAIYKSEMLS